MLLLSCGIEFDEVARNVLEFGLGALFYAVPCTCAKSVDFGRDAFFATVFGKLVQGVYGDEDNVVMGVNELEHLLHVAVDIGA